MRQVFFIVEVTRRFDVTQKNTYDKINKRFKFEVIEMFNPTVFFY